MSTLVFPVGANEGDQFTLNGLGNGAMLKQIWVWVGGWQIKAIKVWLTDGRSMQCGDPSGNPQKFKFEDGEFFDSLSLWGNGAGTRAGAIKFKTNKSREFFVQMTDWGLKTEYPIDVGSGICMGISGKAKEDINCLSFIFINYIESTVMKDVNYPTLSMETPKVVFEEIKCITYHNKSNTTQEYTVQTSRNITKKSSWLLTNKMEMSLNMEVKASILSIVEVNSAFSFTLGTESSYGLENSEETTEQLSFTIQVPPGKFMDVDITIGRVTFNLPYTATVQITCRNGSTLEYPTKGIYKGVTYTNVKSEVTEFSNEPK
ncbi:aerolysin-like protein [Astyanax mexicanus]|uniref:aerolysin-like protein n=1 Tax=Astyanax mexicanus TaxID=7994 RepID=UPI0020CAC8E4|nr:aerolysin-like protein [Astyanax mexicanus]